MTLRAFQQLCTILLLAASLVSTPPGRAAADEALASELKVLSRQQRALERSAREYRGGIQLLLAGDAADPSRENALQALRNQLQRTDAQLEEIARRRAELEAALGVDPGGPLAADGLAASTAPADSEAASEPSPGSGPAQARAEAAAAGEYAAEPQASEQSAREEAQAGSPEDPEAARLVALLSGYYDSSEGAATADAPAGDDPATIAPPLDPDKVRLTGSEGLIALDLISERLANVAQANRREGDIVFHVEIRRDGKLVSSDSHNLTALGKNQYISKIELESGKATISVRRDGWVVDLQGTGAAEYLITLDMPAYGEASLYLIPVEELKAAGIENPPEWLPYLGHVSPERS
jgi:hypothetical protein